MEQHPVPQNVTTFQFRLIGDMTLKQFGYLIGGAIAAYIIFKLPLPFFFTWPLTVCTAVLGFGLAFVPIEERPMDVWVLSFIKNMYSPTQYIWAQSSKAAPKPDAPAQKIVQQAPATKHIFVPNVTPVDHVKKHGLFQWIMDAWEAPKQTVLPVPHIDVSIPPVVKSPTPVVRTEKILEEAQKKESVLEEKLTKLQADLGEKNAAISSYRAASPINRAPC